MTKTPNYDRHQGGYKDQEDLMEELFGRGPGDGDVYNIPYEPDESKAD